MTSTMDIDSNPTGPKRVKLNADNQEIGAGDKVALEGMDEGNKIQAHSFVALVFYEVMTKCFKIIDLNRICSQIMLGVYIMNQVWSVHNYFRSKGNRNEGKVVKAFDEDENEPINLSVHGETFQFSKKSLKEAYETSLNRVGYVLANKSKWMGTVNTIMALWNLFGTRLTEVQIMPNQVTISVDKKGQKTMVKELKHYGIPPGLRHYAYGSSYKPTMKSALAQSLGPATVLTQLAEANNDEFGNKWYDAVVRAFKHVPHIEEVAELMKRSKPKGLEKIIGYLMSIACFTGTREQRRVAFPPGVLARLSIAIDKTTKRMMVNSEFIRRLNFSGAGAFRAYKLMCNLVDSSNNLLSFNINLADVEMGKQVLFHAMFNTHVEDFGILTFMTGYNDWKKRKDFGNRFETMKASKPALSTSFHPIKIVHYSKMASGLLTESVTGGAAPINSCMMMAGHRKRVISDSMRGLLNQGATGVLSSIDKDSVEKHLREFSEMLRGMAKEDSYNAGTVKWHRMDDLTADAEGPELDYRPQESLVIYWSN
ncbi:nucleoprotein [Wellfleet Bay virus]|uniref:Nucleoprotein n=1 Tax=Wellfleet Bay virus TaxID=1566309 RepID=A0A0A1E9N5_9ORTO|nr:nucleoprotein [Wellfleet Bay virus]AIY25032.1 nucleoprotein [Wellfleet Bay virus]